jgi:hypothetical protein
MSEVEETPKDEESPGTVGDYLVEVKEKLDWTMNLASEHLELNMYHHARNASEAIEGMLDSLDEEGNLRFGPPAGGESPDSDYLEPKLNLGGEPT